MEKLKEFKVIIVLVLIILGFAFYWYSYRPMMARKFCIDDSIKFNIALNQLWGDELRIQEDKDYVSCLLTHYGISN